MGHGHALAPLQRQTWLGAFQRLDLGLLIDQEDGDGTGQRVDILQILGEFEIVGVRSRCATSSAVRREALCR
jgi:hypothetical protein